MFNKNNVKVNCSRTKNIKSIISNSNKMILNKRETLNKKNAVVLIKTHPTNECEAENITYQASLNSNELNYDAEHYKDNCETNFKKQFAPHKKII